MYSHINQSTIGKSGSDTLKLRNTVEEKRDEFWRMVYEAVND